MGILNKIRDKYKSKILTQQFKLLNGYTPIFTSYTGGLYEMELTRSAIETIATHCSKLNPVINVKEYKYKNLKGLLATKPNSLMTTQQFLARLVTILLCENNAFIVPIYTDKSGTEIVGLYPVRSVGSRIVELDGIDYLVYKIGNEELIEEYSRVGHLKKHYYKKEYSGESNAALQPTMDLIYTQNEGIKVGIKNNASIRFLARLTNTIAPEHLKKERDALTEANLKNDNNGGIMIFDNKYADVQSITNSPFIVNDKQSELIKKNVFNYFHVSEKVIQNQASEDEWNAFYEGCIEPIAIQISQVLTNMLIEEKDIIKGGNVILESSKLQFASNSTKLNVSEKLFDRGILCINQIMDIWNLPHVENGDKRYIRKEYTEVNDLDKQEVGINE